MGLKQIPENNWKNDFRDLINRLNLHILPSTLYNYLCICWNWDSILPCWEHPLSICGFIKSIVLDQDLTPEPQVKRTLTTCLCCWMLDQRSVGWDEHVCTRASVGTTGSRVSLNRRIAGWGGRLLNLISVTESKNLWREVVWLRSGSAYQSGCTYGPMGFCALSTTVRFGRKLKVGDRGK